MTEKLRLDIPIVLPGIADEAAACVSRLTADLEARDGVEKCICRRQTMNSPRSFAFISTRKAAACPRP